MDKGTVGGIVSKGAVVSKGFVEPTGRTTFRSTIRARERILGMGIGGSGKTSDILSCVARMKHDTVWIIDTDNSFDRMIALEWPDDIGIRQVFSGWVENKGDKDHGGDMVEDTSLPTDPTGQVILFDCQGKGGTLYQQVKWALDFLEPFAKPNDLVVIDSLTMVWDRLKNLFTELVHGDVMSAYFMQVRARIQKRNDRATTKDEEQHNFNAFEGWIDYQPLNATYDDDIRQWLRFPKCHVWVTCESDTLSDRDTKDRQMVDLYGQHGVKPVGQKKSGFDTATIIYKRRTPRSEDRFASTVKDKGRPEMDDLLIPGRPGGQSTFDVEYLEKRAGWKEVPV